MTRRNYLNPCLEHDYGVHLVEDPNTHRLIGLTPAGKYHVRMCDLNADHLIAERGDRTEIWALFRSDAWLRRHGGTTQIPPKIAAALRQQVQQMIPQFPYLPVAQE